MKLEPCGKWRWSVLLILLLLGTAPTDAADYYTHTSMAEHLALLGEREPNLVRVRELARSREDRKVWMVEVGAGAAEDRDLRPALLVISGIEGNDLVGPFTTITWIERLMERYQADSAVTQLLDATTIYVVPCLNPDATQQYFAEPRRENGRNGTPDDADRDGLTDEDGPEDLNGDGVITLMRIEDKEGQYTLDPNEPRLMLKADPLKGETPAWRLLPEGTDNDRDERWNEDGPGGVNFNRNFPYGYAYFAPDAGIHPVSEVETRALADFIVAHPNIGVVLTYGAADNLRKTPKAARSPGRSKPMEAFSDDDIGYYEALGKVYRATLALGKDMEGASEPGTFSDWMYFHRGRLSLAARPWDAAAAIESAKSKKDEDSRQPQDANTPDANEPDVEKKPAKAKSEDKRGKNERDELKWFDEHTPDAFVAWQAIEHPDFPGRRVEVGGYRPFARTNPPVSLLADVAEKQGEFLTDLAGRLPRIGVAKIECHALAESIYEIEILVTNTGFLPTALAHCETSQQVLPTRVTLDLAPAAFLAGAKSTFLPTITGSGGTAKARYVVRVADRDQIKFEVISTLAGRVEGTIELLTASELPSR